MQSQIFGQRFSRGEGNLHYIVKMLQGYRDNQLFISVDNSGEELAKSYPPTIFSTCFCLLNTTWSPQLPHQFINRKKSISFTTFVWTHGDNCVIFPSAVVWWSLQTVQGCVACSGASCSHTATRICDGFEDSVSVCLPLWGLKYLPGNNIFSYKNGEQLIALQMKPDI